MYADVPLALEACDRALFENSRATYMAVSFTLVRLLIEIRVDNLETEIAGVVEVT